MPAAVGAAGAGPPAPQPVVYAVQPGDSLSAIGRRTGVAWEAIAAANGLGPDAVLRVGQPLVVPPPSPPALAPGPGPRADAPAVRVVRDELARPALLRAQPTTRALVLAEVPAGAVLEVLGQERGDALAPGDDLWYGVAWDGRHGYVHAALTRRA